MPKGAPVVQIVLARFVDHSNPAELLRFGIGRRDIDFPALQRRFIAGVVETDDKLLCRDDRAVASKVRQRLPSS